MPSAPKLVSSRRRVPPGDGFLEPAVKNLVMNLQSILAREKKNPACWSCGGSMRRALFEIIHAYDSGTTSARQVCHDCVRYAPSREHDDEGEILYCVMVSFALPRP